MANYTQMLRELIQQRQQIDRVIVELEQLAAEQTGESAPRRRRGRKSVSASERQQISQRMRAYWANRKAKSAAAG